MHNMVPFSSAPSSDVSLVDPGPIGGTTPDKVYCTEIHVPDLANTTLSGTPVVFTIYDEANTPYYFKAYPTKA